MKILVDENIPLMTMPCFASLDELVEFFDTHDLSEYWDQMPEAHFKVDIKTKAHIGNLRNIPSRTGREHPRRLPADERR